MPQHRMRRRAKKVTNPIKHIKIILCHLLSKQPGTNDVFTPETHRQEPPQAATSTWHLVLGVQNFFTTHLVFPSKISVTSQPDFVEKNKNTSSQALLGALNDRGQTLSMSSLSSPLSLSLSSPSSSSSHPDHDIIIIISAPVQAIWLHWMTWWNH